MCRWLDSACDAEHVKQSHPEYSDDKIAQLVGIAKEARACLMEDQALREKLWRCLLSEAGLRSYLIVQE